jgi:WD40 repeat protein
MYNNAFTTSRKLFFLFRLVLKNTDIWHHWESVSSSNFLVISLLFGFNKDRHDPLLYKSRTSSKLPAYIYLLVFFCAATVPLMGQETLGKIGRFAPSGQYLALYRSDDMLQLINMNTGTADSLAWMPNLYDMKFNSAGSKLMLQDFGEDNWVFSLYDIDRRKTDYQLDEVVNYKDVMFVSLQQLDFSSDGRYLLGLFTREGLASVYDSNNGKRLLTLEGNRGEFSHITIDPKGARLLVAGYQNAGRVLSMPDGKEKYRLKLSGVPRSATAARFSPDGKLILVAYEDNHINLWSAQDGASGSVKMRIPSKEGVFSADACQLLAWTEGRSLDLWDVITGTLRLTLPGYETLEFNEVEHKILPAFSIDGNYVMCVVNNRIMVWDTKEGKLTLSIEATSKILDIDYTNCRYITVDGDSLYLYNALSGDLVITYPLNNK